MKYYFDTCIWLNLFKKEKEFWKSAKELVEKALISDKFQIYYSGLVLKELKFVINNKPLFEENSDFLKKFNYIKLIDEDYAFARALEAKTDYKLSFYDYLHLAVCNRNKFILVTRDKDLINIAQQFIIVKIPEELLS